MLLFGKFVKYRRRPGHVEDVLCIERPISVHETLERHLYGACYAGAARFNHVLHTRAPLGRLDPTLQHVHKPNVL